ncbi:hypothetical protein CC85DRAFT_166753 [Cutaneotrichosporon oleaginosum]|uniref:Uncharacterized protein n=1 Tax=Cutaneotrichosporon oleaginosum TaxID=879819 RepID=A0A0J0XG03_9TREE|nr:uncharacterized protein CC85DRAFT_166753 [Cutaneotrichosporon oleaginosum]KLT39996.1 hypothetical protein CC85DRAFT_166753 [Cutaneotrichosporon oleaginosum]
MAQKVELLHEMGTHAGERRVHRQGVVPALHTRWWGQSGSVAESPFVHVPIAPKALVILLYPCATHQQQSVVCNRTCVELHSTSFGLLLPPNLPAPAAAAAGQPPSRRHKGTPCTTGRRTAPWPVACTHHRARLRVGRAHHAPHPRRYGHQEHPQAPMGARADTNAHISARGTMDTEHTTSNAAGAAVTLLPPSPRPQTCRTVRGGLRLRPLSSFHVHGFVSISIQVHCLLPTVRLDYTYKQLWHLLFRPTNNASSSLQQPLQPHPPTPPTQPTHQQCRPSPPFLSSPRTTSPGTTRCGPPSGAPSPKRCTCNLPLTVTH